jgi:hypothetical protein
MCRCANGKPVIKNKIFFPESLPRPRRKGTASSTDKMQRRAALRCCPPLFCHGFCKPTHMHYFVFLKDKKKTNKCNPPHKQKSLPKKM